MGLESDSDFRLWRNAENSIVMKSQVWGHYDEAKRHESANPEQGSRIQAPKDFVTAMLAKLGMDLIVNVQLDRRRRHHSYERSDDDDNGRTPTKAKLYLIGADGRVRTR
jgi:hypothetical protein